ncbi:hypothetical protein E4U42_004003 [Claviceps africana]|uniref:Hexosyltransferase n=1 Tax=Claviceps africana TaxID=83212 RepID=A0A8K0J6Z0_9HYPO|nr:hypothetical protein E4U42_004003 [Claviceps africana]
MIALDSSRSKRPNATWLRLAILQRISRRHVRFALVGVFFAFSLVLYLSLLHSRPRTWTVETIVHDHDTTRLHTPPQTLLPFPDSPQQPHRPAPEHDSPPQARPWLAAVICAAQDVERRMLIRSTWMRLFRDVPFVPRFVVSNPGAGWNETVRYENRTFGDMIVLDHLVEDDLTANTVKTLEFFKWLLNSGQRYEYVTKLDTDLWLNAPAFWHRYLVPRLDLSNDGAGPRYAATVKRTVIGQLYFSDSGYNTFAHGSMYTMTWDMMELLVGLQERFSVITGEDATVGILMHKASERASFVNLGGGEKFDYDDADSRGDGTAYARAATHPQAQSHALHGQDVIAVHRLKDKELWMKVARCFTEKGIKPAPRLAGAVEASPPLHVRLADFLHSWGLWDAYQPMFDAIPKELLHYENGHLICDGIWDLGKVSARGS